VSLGERADVDFGDLLDHLGSDAQTRSILLYIESIEERASSCRQRGRRHGNKPVIVVKAGRAGSGLKAAASHNRCARRLGPRLRCCHPPRRHVARGQPAGLVVAAETLSRFRGGHDAA
jgi:acetyltransferase